LAALARRADLLINRDHARYSVVIAIEAKLRACFTASASPERLGEAGGVLRSAVVRLRKLAESPGSRTGQRTGLAKWFDGLMGRLPEEMLADSTVADWLARGLALCDHFAEQETRELPRGLDAEVYREELRRAASKGWSITECALGLDSDNESPQQPFLLPREGDERRKCLPLTLFRRAGRSLQIGYEASAQTWRHARFSHPPEAAPLPLPSSPVSFHLSSYWQELWFDALQRPSWARRMWYDRYGLAAEFRVGETPFVLRWIPPGRFLMGSPEAEPGWSKAEGPQHEVVISRGFWLGETPVTQVQWRAVVENAGKAAAARGLEPSPSHFSGPDTLPVEQVSWPEARDFCSLMEGALVDSPGFRLPTEAEWEYACRAGMVDALWSGPIKIEADHDAPALEEIAWYVGNSWRDLEVEKPFAMKDLPWKHPKGNRAGAHRVKGKEANPWGLYDMLGNVWEWCRDAWNDEAYQRRERLTYDPMVRIDDVAERVVRGGSWSDLAQDCRSAYRDGNPPGSRIHGLGFRLAAGQEPEAAEPPGAERPTARERAAGRRPTAPSRGAARRRPAK
jgi:formylglycine-generating enzyme required for sulfatase activity